MASQGDDNRLAPSETVPDLVRGVSLDISEDEAQESGQQQTRTGPVPVESQASPPQIGNLQPPTRDASIHTDPGSEPMFGPPSLDQVRLAASKRQKGFIAYLGRPAGGDVRMEQSRPTVAELTSSDAGLKAMNDQWEGSGVFHQWVKPAIRWIHLPANNPGWIEGAMYHILNTVVRREDEAWMLNRLFAETTMQEILRPGYWANQLNTGLPHLAHSRFVRPFCRRMRNVPESANKLGASEHVVYLMPYIHWETGAGFDAMTKAIKGSQGESTGCYNREGEVLQAYLPGPNPMHVRRSLDQSYYSTLADTSKRDKDQVVQKYSRKKLGKQDAECPMLMVDQCWLWILGANTVLTAFPQRWSNQDDSSVVIDPTDVLSSILEDLAQDTIRSRLGDAESLAYLIIDRCASNIFDPDSITNTDLQFLRFFSESIDELNEAQSQSLKRLWRDVRKSKEGPVDDSLFDMKKDFDILEGIKDIMEELSMLMQVAQHQKRAFRSLDQEGTSPRGDGLLDRSSHHSGQRLRGPIQRRRSDGATLLVPLRPATSPSLTGRTAPSRQRPRPLFDDNSADERRDEKRSPILPEVLKRAEERYLDFEGLVNKAQATYKALHDLLDLKQRQANLSEAMQARRSANEMEVQNEKLQDQNNSIMLFTVVTILFLPLSSLASIFGINAHEFGQGYVSLARIFAYLFPISAFVVGFTFLLAFNQNIRMVLLLWLEIFGIWLLLWFPTVSVNHYVQDLEKKLAAMQKKKSARGEARYEENKKWKAGRPERRAARERQIKKVDKIIEMQRQAREEDNSVANTSSGQRPVSEPQRGLANGVPGARPIPPSPATRRGFRFSKNARSETTANPSPLDSQV